MITGTWEDAVAALGPRLFTGSRFGDDVGSLLVWTRGGQNRRAGFRRGPATRFSTKATAPCTLPPPPQEEGEEDGSYTRSTRLPAATARRVILPGVLERAATRMAEIG